MNINDNDHLIVNYNQNLELYKLYKEVERERRRRKKWSKDVELCR